jgi:hypothetical protein
MHVYAETGDPHEAIEQAIVFAGYAVGGEPGDKAFPFLDIDLDFLTGHRLRAMWKMEKLRLTGW